MSPSSNEQVKSVLMVDIVDFSKKHFAKDMESAVKHLYDLLREAIPEEHNNKRFRIWSPTGDGGALTFTDIWDAYHTAINLSQKVSEYNQSSPKDEPILQVRIGLHAGTVVQAEDFDGRVNVWGHGINMAARILGAAKPGQILVSEWYHNLLTNPTPTGEKIFRKFGRWWFKHNTPMNLYNMYSRMDDNEIGIETFESENWYRPYAYPVNQAILTYYGMFEDHIDDTSLNPFHALLIGKRLIDLLPEQTIEADIEGKLQKKLRRQPHPFFSSLPYDDLRILLKHSEIREYDPGESIRLDRYDEYLLSVIFGKVTIECPGSVACEKTEGESHTNIGFVSEDRPQHSITVAERTALLFLNITREEQDIPQYERENPFSHLKKHLWKLQQEQIKSQILESFPVFQTLTSRDFQELFADARVLPQQYGKTVNEEIPADPRWIWDSWIYVLSGDVSVQAQCIRNLAGDDRPVKYHDNELMGTLRWHFVEDSVRLGVPEFGDFFASDDAILIVFSWDSIDRCLRHNQDFQESCSRYFRNHESERWDGIYG
jgi:class 3 adenylate cyclase